MKKYIFGLITLISSLLLFSCASTSGAKNTDGYETVWSYNDPVKISNSDFLSTYGTLPKYKTQVVAFNPKENFEVPADYDYPKLSRTQKYRTTTDVKEFFDENSLQNTGLHITGYVITKDTKYVSDYGYIFNDSNSDYLYTKEDVWNVVKANLSDSLKTGKSYFLTILFQEQYKEVSDLGIVFSYVKGKEADGRHVIKVEKNICLLDYYLEEFDDNDALDSFLYGITDGEVRNSKKVTVNSPAGGFNIYESLLPDPKIPEISSKNIRASTPIINEDTLVLNFDESVNPTFSLPSHYHNKDALNVGKLFNVRIDITKKQNGCYVSKTGWKIYPSNKVMDTFLNNKVGNTVNGLYDNVCFMPYVTKNGNSYELVLVAVKANKI